MKRDREIAKRMRDMLIHDKVGVKEGFSTALTGDLNRILNDYFDLTDAAEIDIVLMDSGEYRITVSASATRIKQFETTFDIKRY